MKDSAAVRLLVSHSLAATATSMPWPLLLAQVWSVTGSDLWLGLTGAARMLPYVVLSAAAGILADRLSRASVLRWSAGVRTLLLAGCGSALLADQLGVAVVLAMLTVAAGTPSYPAGVAVLPGLAGDRTGPLTNLLVTIEVAAFVVGPAVGGVLLGFGYGGSSVALAAGLALPAWLLLRGLPNPSGVTVTPEAHQRRLPTVLGTPGVPAAIAVVALQNFVESALGVGLLSLSHDHWKAGDAGFGLGTAALGFGSLAAPLLAALLRMRGSLLVSAGSLGLAGVVPAVAVAAGPLLLAGASGTVVECVATEVLQRRLPDRVRAFSLGLADSVMVLAALLGALAAPSLTTLLGPVAMFVGLAATLAVVAIGFPLWRQFGWPTGVRPDHRAVS
jgi:MFS family permease